MPIKFLESGDSNFPRLGKVKKGAAKTESGAGMDLDYFRFDTQRPDVKQILVDIYGSQPRELRVWLLHSEIEENFDPWMKEYSGSTLKRQCDGENQYIWLEKGKIKSVNGGYEPIPCVRETTGCQCKQTAHLHVMIAELFAQGITGYFAVETHSINDILGITANLRAAYGIRQNLCGIPFILRRQMRSISTPRGESRARVDKSLLSIEPDPAWVQSQFQRMYQASLSFAPATEEPLAFHSTGMAQGSYLLPAHHAAGAGEAIADGLRTAKPTPAPRPTPKPTPRPTPAAPTPSTPATTPVTTPANTDNINRIKGLLEICGLPNETAKRIRTTLFGDRLIATYTPADLARLRSLFYLEWATGLECWSEAVTKDLAWAKFVGGEGVSDEMPDNDFFDAWMAYCLDLCESVESIESIESVEVEVVEVEPIAS